MAVRPHGAECFEFRLCACTDTGLDALARTARWNLHCTSGGHKDGRFPGTACRLVPVCTLGRDTCSGRIARTPRQDCLGGDGRPGVMLLVFFSYGIVYLLNFMAASRIFSGYLRYEKSSWTCCQRIVSVADSRLSLACLSVL